MSYDRDIRQDILVVDKSRAQRIDVRVVHR